MSSRPPPSPRSCTRQRGAVISRVPSLAMPAPAPGEVRGYQPAASRWPRSRKWSSRLWSSCRRRSRCQRLAAAFDRVAANRDVGEGHYRASLSMPLPSPKSAPPFDASPRVIVSLLSRFTPAAVSGKTPMVNNVPICSQSMICRSPAGLILHDRERVRRRALLLVDNHVVLDLFRRLR